MEQKKIKRIFSLLLTIMFFTACAAPSNNPTTELQATQTVPPPAAEGVMPVTGEGLCMNAYYPVRQGATWSYKSTNTSAGEYSFTDTISSVRADGFALATQFGNVTRTQEWSCKPEGLVAMQFGGAPAAMLNAQNMQLNLQTNSVSGVTFPSQINAGDTWQHTLDLQGSMIVLEQEGTATGSAQNNFTAIGIESVTVPAGTFDAMKIQVDTTLNMDVSYQGLSVPVTFSSSYTYWFVQGIGWVKSSGTGSVAGASFGETTELQSYSIP